MIVKSICWWKLYCLKEIQRKYNGPNHLSIFHTKQRQEVRSWEQKQLKAKKWEAKFASLLTWERQLGLFLYARSLCVLDLLVCNSEPCWFSHTITTLVFLNCNLISFTLSYVFQAIGLGHYFHAAFFVGRGIRAFPSAYAKKKKKKKSILALLKATFF